MEAIYQALTSLIKELESGPTPPEPIVLEALGRLMAAKRSLTGHNNAAAVETQFARLNQFWLQSVPWCSDLSRKLERILMEYKESCEQKGRP